MLTLYRYNLTTLLTQGILLFNNDYLSDTLELPWKNNVDFVSCIPEGLYKLVWNEKDHKWPCYEVHGVPKREGILMHPANYLKQLEGCIAPGTKYAEAIWNSGKALTKIHEIVGSEVSLVITSKFGAQI